MDDPPFSLLRRVARVSSTVARIRLGNRARRFRNSRSIRVHTEGMADRARLDELMRMEFSNLTAQFQANEEMGERRVALLVTLTAGLGAAAAFAHEHLGAKDLPELWLGVNAAWLLFGYLTLLRILQRNAVSDRYKLRLRELRKWFVDEGDTDGRRHLPFDPYGAEETHRAGLRFFAGSGGKGGYAELVAFVNSMTAGALGWQLGFWAGWFFGPAQGATLQRPVGAAFGLLFGWLWWRRQAVLAEHFYVRARTS